MRRRKAGISISLFPFLAVLLCAMGALILLLLVMSRQIRETAVARRATPSPVAAPAGRPPAVPAVTMTIREPALPAPPDPNVELRHRLAIATTRRDEALREVERLRLAIARRKDAARTAQERSAAAAFDVQAARERLAAREAELREREAERQRLLAEVRQAEGTLARVRQAAEAAEPKVSIVPYDGRSGTARRPILIECRGEVIRFVPEDIRLTASDVADFLPDYNPLLAGATALRGYWQEMDGPSSSRPYVLLLVYEDGVAAYYAARTLLRPIGSETGYELVTDELNLSVPKLDPAAQAVCRDAVLEALNHRTEVLAEVARRSRNEPLLPSDPFHADPFGDGSPFGRGSGGSGAPPLTRLPSQGGSLAPPDAPAPEGPGRVVTADAGEPLPPAVSDTDVAAPRRLSEIIPPSRSRSAIALSGRGAPESRESRSPLTAQTAPSLDTQATPSLEEEMAEELPDFGRSAAGRKRWGVSAPTASISLERPMPVVVTADAITVGSQEPIPLSEGVTRETAAAVLDAVEREAAAWGRSPGQFYWSPRLRASVRPGGTAHYDRLKRLLAGTGLTAGARIELDPPVPAFVELRYGQAAP